MGAGASGLCSASAFARGLLQAVDLRVGGVDERIELGNLLRVLPLLVFAEAEEVGGVRRTPAVEEEFVFADDGGRTQRLSSSRRLPVQPMICRCRLTFVPAAL